MLRAFKAVRTVSVLVVSMAFAHAANAQHYNRTDLTQNASGVSATATHTDPNLVNAWGLARSSGSPWWISDNGTGLSTLYDLTGAAQALVVTIPPPAKLTGPSAPTGTIFNYTGAFDVAPGKPAVFLFVTEDGTISGWNPAVNATNAVRVIDRSGHAIYKGCALATTRGGPVLYATNFQTGKVEAYDGNFKRLNLAEGAFSAGVEIEDSDLQYVPFNIQNVGGNLVVTFAAKRAGDKDETAGAGLGQVEVFDTSGRRLLRLQHGPWFNAPWGVALAPGDFGAFSHRLLVGNFGDGTVHAFDSVSGRFDGTLLGTDGSPIQVNGLWAISFGGDGAKNGLATELYFTAGPNDESNGLFGKIAAVSTEQRGNAE
jgi:uncharacterized protein (TIGR03118 family)